MWYKISRIEFVKNQKNKMEHKTKQIYFSNLYWLHCSHWYIFHYNIIKLLFHYVLTCSAKCFICSTALCLLSSSDFVHRPHWCVYLQILYNTMVLYEWKLNLIWSCKLIICKIITEHTCWSFSMLLTHHIKIFRRDNSMPK